MAESHYMHRFMHTIQDFFLTQHVKSPTHFMPNKMASTLDLIFTSEEGMVTDLKHLPPLGNSHHDCLSFTLRCRVITSEGGNLARDYERADYKSMVQAVIESDLVHHLQICDLQTAWTHLISLLSSLEKRYIPLKTLTKKKQHPYSNKRLLQVRREKDKLYGQYRRTGSVEDQLLFKRAKNNLRNLTRKLRLEYERKLVKYTIKNPKVFWKYLGSKLKTRIRVEDLEKPDGSRACTSEEKADTLNNFFGSVFTAEDITNIPETDFGFDGEGITSVDIRVEEIRKRLENLNISKSPGPDGLHPRVLKELAAPLSEILEVIFTSSLETGSLPAEWREGHVVPIFKKGDRSQPSNYRPVSLTSVICKLLESLVRDALLQHFLDNDLLTSDQFGFLPGKSCALQLLVVMEEWLEVLDRRGAVDVVYLDFQKAFDRVPHQRLLSKLKAYGVGGNLLQWISAFLSNRRQRVVVEGKHSSWMEVSSGIPQGSVLGPLLFLVYINDLPSNVGSCSKLFADDTKLYREVSDVDDMAQLQNDVDSLELWAEKWQLPFNKSKCSLMHLGSSNQHFTYQMGGTDIAQVNVEKDLGLLVDDTLKFHKQTAAAVSRANRVLGLVRRAFIALDCQSLCLLYRTLIRPHLEYANSVWGPTSKTDQDAVERVQRRATRMVRSLRHLSYQDRLRALKLPSLHYRRMRGDMIMTYQILTGRMMVRTADLLERDLSDRTRGHQLKLKRVRVSSHLRQNSFCYRVVTPWNSLTDQVVSATSVNSFKNRLDKLWKDRWYDLRSARD